MIRVPLSTVTGKEFAVMIDKENTVGQLKQLLEKDYNLNAYYLKLIFQAGILPDNKRIKDIKFNGSFIFVHQSNLCAMRPTKPGPLPSISTKKANHFVPEPGKTNSDLIQHENIKDQINHEADADSQDFDSLVKNLIDLGFDPKLCKRALKISDNDVNAAASLLLSGDISIFQQNQVQQPPTILNGRDQMISKYKTLNSDQQAAVNRLQSLGFDIETVLQIYFACEKNEKMTKDCLLSMK